MMWCVWVGEELLQLMDWFYFDESQEYKWFWEVYVCTREEQSKIFCCSHLLGSQQDSTTPRIRPTSPSFDSPICEVSLREQMKCFYFCPPPLIRMYSVWVSVASVGFFFFFVFCLFRAMPAAYGGSQARDLIGDTAASQPQQRQIKLHLRPTPQLMATPNP